MISNNSSSEYSCSCEPVSSIGKTKSLSIIYLFKAIAIEFSLISTITSPYLISSIVKFNACNFSLSSPNQDKSS